MPSRLTPEQRSQRAQIAAFVLHSQVDSVEHTAPARAAFLARFERDVDPDGVLPEEERLRRAECARKAYFRQLALKSARRRARRERS